MPLSKSYGVETSAQIAPTYRLKAAIAPRATLRGAVDFDYHMSTPDAITTQQARAGHTGRALACGAKRGRRWTALRVSDKPNVLSRQAAQSTRLTCRVIEILI